MTDLAQLSLLLNARSNVSFFSHANILNCISHILLLLHSPPRVRLYLFTFSSLPSVACFILWSPKCPIWLAVLSSHTWWGGTKGHPYFWWCQESQQQRQQLHLTMWGSAEDQTCSLNNPVIVLLTRPALRVFEALALVPELQDGGQGACLVHS